MKNSFFLTVFAVILSLSTSAQNTTTLSGIHDDIDPNLTAFLEKESLGKITIYFDEKNQKEGKWEYYPFVKISDNLTAVHINSLSNNHDVYSFLIILNSVNYEITDTLGPFYDSYVEAIEWKIKNNQVNYLKIKLVNPPSQFDSKYTYVKFKRNTEALVEYKSSNKN